MALPYTFGQLQARFTPVFRRNSVRCAALFGSYSQCKVDLIDVKNVIPNAKLDQEIPRTGVLLYEQ